MRGPPLALASLATGLVSSLGTTWGLIRHYWVVFKLVLTLVAVLILLQYTQTVGDLARLAAANVEDAAELRALGASPVLHAAGGVLILLVNTVLGIAKPRGMTRHGRRKQAAPR